MEIVDATKSIAVLPFANQSGLAEQDYLCDGITEEVINALSRIDELKVTSRTSSFFFKGKQVSLSEIGEALNVGIILEGSIRVAGQQMRITARLIDVQDDVQFWSESFDRSLEDIFAVQDEISLLIAERLREQLGHFELEDQLLPRPQASASSYQDYLRARYLLLKMGKGDVEEGLRILEDILKVDPDFAHAHLGIHMAYTLLGSLGLIQAPEGFAKGQPHLDKAIELQPELPECQIQLAWNAFLQAWDLPTTYKHLQQSAQVRPTTDYYQTMASCLVAEGRFKAAHHYIDLAQQVDPFSHIAFHLKGFIYYCEGAHEKALSCYSRSIELNPASTVSLLYTGQALIALERYDESLRFFQQLPPDEPGDMIKLGGMALTLAASGRLKEGGDEFAQIEDAIASDMMGRATQLMVLINSAMGNHEEAMHQFEQGLEKHLPLLIYLFTDPLLQSLQTKPSFQSWKEKIFGTPAEISAPSRKYKQTLLDAESLAQYKAQLNTLMEVEQPHLDPKLSLRELATQLGIPPNQLSQLLNEGFQQNFAEYVNSYRLQTFKSKVADASLHHLTLLAIAYDSGFNSKTVFNTFFKKKMGMTPKAYWKQIIKPE